MDTFQKKRWPNFVDQLGLAPCVWVAVNFFPLLAREIFPVSQVSLSWGLVQLLQLFSHNSVQLLLHIMIMI